MERLWATAAVRKSRSFPWLVVAAKRRRAMKEVYRALMARFLTKSAGLHRVGCEFSFILRGVCERGEVRWRLGMGGAGCG